MLEIHEARTKLFCLFQSMVCRDFHLYIVSLGIKVLHNIEKHIIMV